MTTKRILSAVLVLGVCVFMVGCKNGPLRARMCDDYCEDQASRQQTMMQPMMYMQTLPQYTAPVSGSRVCAPCAAPACSPCEAPACSPCEPCGVCDPCN
ncbi:MAG: hypothetical protein PHE53_09620 [Thermoguttaceae bacterium]|nr:hypothetical protein [Thermoguttaceae bacterium]